LKLEVICGHLAMVSGAPLPFDEIRWMSEKQPSSTEPKRDEVDERRSKETTIWEEEYYS
jgi:hypothetical protein